jgi:hypothetical protein
MIMCSFSHGPVFVSVRCSAKGSVHGAVHGSAYGSVHGPANSSAASSVDGLGLWSGHENLICKMKFQLCQAFVQLMV